VSRVSLGAQSFDARQLEALGRIHSPEETRRAAEELHAAGIDNFNLDLMYALPGQDAAAAVRDVDAAVSLAPAHLSHYELTLEPGTVFAALPPALPPDDVAAEILAACGARLSEAGFAQYEVSGYAKANRRCRHNLNYWMFGDYLGVGAGAHGKLSSAATGSIVRTAQAREPRRYLAGLPAIPTRRLVPGRDLPFEFMLNALRLVEGFEISTYRQRTGLDWDTVAARIEGLHAQGLLVSEGGRVRASVRGLQFLNDLLLGFLAETPQTSEACGLSSVV
jgi:oxygen-independent coproporphyrinogen-3 oxidase